MMKEFLEFLKEYGIVGLAIAVQVNDGTNVTSFQSFAGNGLRQNYSVMFLNHLLLFS